MTTPPCRHPWHSRGLSMVELMVSLAVGMVVIAFAVSAMASQAAASRRVLLEVRLNQDLRAAADLVARHVRRAGHWSEAADGVWRSGQGSPSANPNTFTAEAPDLLRFTYSSPTSGPHDGTRSNDQFGIRLRQGILDIELGDGNWQPLTDPSALRVTALRLAPHAHERPLPAACAIPCPARAGTCTPLVRVRGVDIHLDAMATRDPGVRRQIAMNVRPRNDVLVDRCRP